MSATIENTTSKFELGTHSYSDDFEAYSEASLDGQGNWNVVKGTINVRDDTGNKVFYPYALGSYCIAYYDATVTDNQRSKITIYAIGGTTYVGVAVRIGADGNSYYLYFARGGARWVEGCISGTPFDIASAADTTSTNDTLEIVIEGSTITCYLNGEVDTALGSAQAPATGSAGVYTDTRVTSGYVGISGKENETYAEGDNWEGGDV